jgi:DNA-binding PadR family transcriptional regulator
LTRLERDGLLKWEDVHQGDKPDKKVYYITDKGRETFIQWLGEKPDWNLYPDEMAFKFAAFKLVGMDISKDILKQYRTFLLQMIKHLFSIKEGTSDENVLQLLMIERNILRAEADLKWIEMCNERWGDIE